MLDLRNLKVAAPGIMRRAPASEFNGTKMLRSVQRVSATCALTLRSAHSPLEFWSSSCRCALVDLQRYFVDSLALT